MIKLVIPTSGLFYSAWVIPYGIFVVVMALIYFRFLLSLPRRIGVIFVLSGAIYISGAIGVEILDGLIIEARGKLNLDYMILATIEETLEMVGIYAFIYGLLGYLTMGGRRLGIAFVK